VPARPRTHRRHRCRGLLDQAVAGMDDALLKAVDANRVALGQLSAQGADLRDKHLKQGAVRPGEDGGHDVRDGSRRPPAVPAQPIGRCLGPGAREDAGRRHAVGRQAATTEQMAEQMQSAMRTLRAASLRAAQALAESYTAMVSGVLMGMSEALQSGRQGGARSPARAAGRARSGRRGPRCTAAKPNDHPGRRQARRAVPLMRAAGLHCRAHEKRRHQRHRPVPPPHVITNAELVQAFNAYADLQNEPQRPAIAAGELPSRWCTPAWSSSRRPRASSSAM
jgi:hypothetical protein